MITESERMVPVVTDSLPVFFHSHYPLFYGNYNRKFLIGINTFNICKIALLHHSNFLFHRTFSIKFSPFFPAFQISFCQFTFHQVILPIGIKPIIQFCRTRTKLIIINKQSPFWKLVIYSTKQFRFLFIFK